MTPEREPGPDRQERLDYHDPTAGVGGAPPAASALTLRLLMAATAIALCVLGIVLGQLEHGPTWLTVVLAVVAVTAVVDGVVIVRRKRRGEPG
ncbi:MAG TPA: DUF6343 family protein [Mycobacteriales bacterium]|nr:DUF6343 family protein [Mycobacteriales bacterium]